MDPWWSMLWCMQLLPANPKWKERSPWHLEMVMESWAGSANLSSRTWFRALEWPPCHEDLVRIVEIWSLRDCHSWGVIWVVCVCICVCVYLCVCHTRRGHESPNKHGARQTGPTSAAKPPHCYLEHHISSLQTHACTNRHIRLNFAVIEYFSIPLSFKDGCAPAGSFRASRKCLWKTIEPSGHT